MKHKLSIVLSVFNEEEKIEKSLKSVRWADEIIVVDNSSTDKTKEIAKNYTQNIYTQKNNPLRVDTQKNIGFDKAKNEWILSLDADEEVSEELKSEIQKLLDTENLKDGYFIPRINYIFGKRIEYGGWYPDHQLRLFKKEKGKYREENVHEGIRVDGEVDYLKEHLIHQNYQSISQFVQKNFVIYAKIQAKKLIKDGFELKPGDLLSIPAKEFLRRFFSRKAYKDGLHGLFLSLLMAASHLVMLAYVWEEKGFREESSKIVFKSFEEEFSKNQKEFSYWVGKIKLEEAKSLVEKLKIKLKTKF